MERNFYASAPNQKLATDVTEFRVPNTGKKLYLGVIINLYDRYPVTFVLSSRNNNQLVLKTFDKAISENPTAKPIFNSNRGFQYNSMAFKKKLKDNGITQSMSKVDRCIDNDPTARFFGYHKVRNILNI
ncbi:transposase [Clostridium perfringens]